MKKLFYLLMIILASLSAVSSNAYKITTTNVTGCIHNSDFSNLDGWYPYFTNSLSTVKIVTFSNDTGVLLASNYYSGTTSARAGIRIYSIDSDYYPINLVNSNDTTTEIVHDALLVKIQYKAASSDCLSGSYGFISGNLCVFMEGALSCSIDRNHTSVPYMTDDRIYELGGFNVSTSQPLYGIATNWTDMSFYFVPPEESDWWQIRDFEIMYEGMPNQPYVSGLIINKVELYAIRVDAQ
jgi:hypothetical protein